MKIIADAEGKKAIQELLDIYVKTEGIKAAQGALQFLSQIEDYVDPEVEESDD